MICTKHDWKSTQFNKSFYNYEYCSICKIPRGDESNTLKFKKMYMDVIIPQYQTKGSVGFDIHAYNEFSLPPQGWGVVTTGLKVQIPCDSEMTIRQRSGLSKSFPNYIAIGIGTIDTDYRGQIMIPVVNNSTIDFVISKGMRIAQGIVSPIIRCIVEEVDELSDTERGEGGFGSTGGTTKQ